MKEAVSIPVIGNGDIFSGEDAVAMREQTGCDGIMVGRGAKGNPWIFREIKAALEGRPIPERPELKEVVAMLLRQTESAIRFKGEYTAIREMRKHTAWYTTGMHGSSRIREAVNQVTDFEHMKKLLFELTSHKF